MVGLAACPPVLGISTSCSGRVRKNVLGMATRAPKQQKEGSSTFFSGHEQKAARGTALLAARLLAPGILIS